MTEFSSPDIASDPSPLPDTADDYALAFTPVPLSRTRHDGWTVDRQRRFILQLRDTGVVSTAARAIGCSAQSAYRLRSRPGAESFADAWDSALGEARDRAFDLAMDRATNGFTIPRYYRGNFVGTLHRIDTRLALAALNAADRQMHARAKGEK